jgi:equilibrative nucleoside transporter 1/2/3
MNRLQTQNNSRIDNNNNNNNIEYHVVSQYTEEEEPCRSPSLNVPPIPFKDEGNAVYIIFFILGVGMLFPWNCFITSNEYFGIRFKGSVFADNFQNYFSVTFMLSNLLFVSFILFFILNRKNEIGMNLTYNPKKGIAFGFIVLALIFISCIFIAISNLNEYYCFFLTIFLVFISGACTSFIQNGIFSLASAFPPRYTQSVLYGQALAGLLVVFSQILSLLVKPVGNEESSIEEIRLSAIIYFSFAALVCIIALLCFFMMLKNPFFLHYSSLDESDDCLFISSDHPVQGSSILKIFSSIWKLVLSVFFNLFITLSLFPSILSLIRSFDRHDNNASRLFKDLFIPFAFLVFNICDWVGRALPGVKRLAFKNHTTILFFALIRLVFFPLFLFSNIILSDPKNRHEYPRPDLPLIINTDVGYLILVAFFAVSNGYAGSLAMMFAPNSFPAKADKGKAASLMVFCLTLGLCIGSGFSFVCRHFLESAIPKY